MSRAWLIILFVAIASCITTYWVYGLSAFIFLPIFSLMFFVIFGLVSISDSIQAKSIPGLQEMNEPDFFFSRIYMAWLYVNDRGRWAKYSAFFSYLVGALIGSMFGTVILVTSKVDFNASFVSWLLGMFITLLIAVRMVKSKRWTETRSTRQL